MKIATYANSRTSYAAIHSLSGAFKVAYRAGCVMGFFLTSFGLLVLVLIIIAYRMVYGNV